MGVYVQLTNELKQLDKLTKSKVVRALGYTPANEENLPDVTNDSDDCLLVQDSAGNIIAKIDQNGLHTTNVNLNGDIIDNNASEFSISDADGNIVAKVDNRGVHTTNINLEGDIVSNDSDAFFVSDENGNLIFKIDGEGIHSVELVSGGVKVKETLVSHIVDKNNPHGVTKAQVGLGNVDNTSDENKRISIPQQKGLDDLKKELSEKSVSEATSWNVVDEDGNIVAMIDAQGVHTTEVWLPDGKVSSYLEQVTKESLGLGNVDNTSDMDKPISTAQQKALDYIDNVLGYQSSSISAVASTANKTYYEMESRVKTRDAIRNLELTMDMSSDAKLEFENWMTPSAIDWGDGDISQYDYALKSYSHTYDTSSSTTYDISVYGITDIANRVFEYDTRLLKVRIPGSVSTVGEYAFGDCTNLAAVTIENGVSTIAFRAFYQCTSLTSFAIPESVSTLGRGAFQGCTNLTAVTIGNSSLTIEENVFYKCSSLAKIIFNGTMAEWAAITSSVTIDPSSGEYCVYCLDGVLAKDGTSINGGGTSGDDSGGGTSNEALTAAINEVNQALTQHSGNAAIHVTATDKTKWNSIVSAKYKIAYLVDTTTREDGWYKTYTAGTDAPIKDFTKIYSVSVTNRKTNPDSGGTIWAAYLTSDTSCTIICDQLIAAGLLGGVNHGFIAIFIGE